MRFPFPSAKVIAPLLLCLLLATWVQVERAEARAGGGGRSFSSSRSTAPRSNNYSAPTNRNNQYGRPAAPAGGGFLRGLAGGLVGGALGSMLFGSLAHGSGGGIGGGGIGLFQILILGGIGYFVYVKFFKRPKQFGNQNRPEYDRVTPFNQNQEQEESPPAYDMPPPPPPTIEEGLELIRQSEPDFDLFHFKEVASEVFFKIQAGWMRREIEPIAHLLDAQLAAEYSQNFAELKSKGLRNRLENIAIRAVELAQAGIDDNEEFIALRFTANLLDYTEEEGSGKIVAGSNTEPVRFSEQWTWSRPIGNLNWKLSGIRE